MMTTEIVRISDTSSREQIAEAISALRAKAKRYSASDPKRQAIDDECDQLVTEWLAAES